MILWARHFFSENQRKKRRWSKIMEFRKQMIAAKADGNNEKWKELNAQRENLLGEIFEKIKRQKT